MTVAVGVAGFVLVVALLVGGEVAGRVRRGRFATIPEVMGWLRTQPFFRVAMLVSWAFVGVHFFVR